MMSTSDWKELRAYSCGEWANEGALIIVPLLQPYPFGVAKLTRAHANGDIEYQWWGNDTDNIGKPYNPGWLSDKGKNGERSLYYQQERRDDNHLPYVGHEDLPMTQKDIVVHSFKLAKSGKLPMVVLKAIDEDYRIWWTKKPIEP